MAGGTDWGFPETCEGNQDPYETRQLQNGLLAGTAGSPYSRSDGIMLPMPLHHRIPSPTDSFHEYSLAGGFNDGTFHGPALPTGYNQLRYLDFPDMSGLSMFSSDGFQNSGPLHGLPMPQSSGLFAGLSPGNSSHAPVPSSSTFGSFSSPSNNTSAPFCGSSFGSMSSGSESSAIMAASHQNMGSNTSCNEIGMPVAANSWPTATPDGTMSPKDIPLKRGLSPVSVPDQPPLLLFHEDEAEQESDQDDAPDTPPRQSLSPSPSRPSPSKKQRKASDTASTRGRPRKSLPDRAPRARKAQASRTPTSKNHERVEKIPNSSRRASAKEKPTSAKTSARIAHAKPALAPPRKILPSPVVRTSQVASDGVSGESATKDAENVRDAASVESQQASKKPTGSAAISSTSDRDLKDKFLLTSKQSGMTYREIRVAGNFKEAESTLRGRYRTLTKSKENRVRKPEWSEKDIQLLRKAVRKFTKTSSEGRAKVPWKQVAEYIHDRGGSYLFGNATCRKKWDELVAQMKENEGEK